MCCARLEPVVPLRDSFSAAVRPAHGIVALIPRDPPDHQILVASALLPVCYVCFVVCRSRCVWRVAAAWGD